MNLADEQARMRAKFDPYRIPKPVRRSGRKPRKIEVETALKRFWEKVDQSGECWIWKAAKSSTGRGMFCFNNIVMSAPRWIYQQTYGPIANYVHVHHKCSSKLCVRPDHLEALDRDDHVNEHHPAYFAPESEWKLWGIGPIKFFYFRCQRCNHEWVPRKQRITKQCPGCASRLWRCAKTPPSVGNPPNSMKTDSL